MSSEYDKIKTAKELVNHVMVHGFSTKTDDVVRAQDIFGNSTIEELAFLANDIGRDDKDGNPDPKGTMCSGRRATRGTFYSILFQIWNWEDATRFWNAHTNPEHERLAELRTENAALKTIAKQAEVDRERFNKERADREAYIDEKLAILEEAIHKAEAAENEIMRLKAKLYDLTVGKEE